MRRITYVLPPLNYLQSSENDNDYHSPSMLLILRYAMLYILYHSSWKSIETLVSNVKYIISQIRRQRFSSVPWTNVVLVADRLRRGTLSDRVDQMRGESVKRHGGWQSSLHRIGEQRFFDEADVAGLFALGFGCFRANAVARQMVLDQQQAGVARAAHHAEQRIHA